MSFLPSRRVTSPRKPSRLTSSALTAPPNCNGLCPCHIWFCPVALPCGPWLCPQHTGQGALAPCQTGLAQKHFQHPLGPWGPPQPLALP